MKMSKKITKTHRVGIDSSATAMPFFFKVQLNIVENLFGYCPLASLKENSITEYF